MKRSVLPILAVLGLAWAAFACASASAESTVLCKANEEPCKAANVYPEGSTIVAEATGTSDQVKIATFGVTIKCPSKLEATVGAGSDGTELLSVTSWSLGNSAGFSSEWCTGLSSSGDCGTASGENLPYSAEVTSEKSLNVSGLSWHLHCKLGGVTYIDCTYHEGKNHPQFTSDHKTFEYNKYYIQHTGSACGGSVAELSGTFRTKSPMYVSWMEPLAYTGKPNLVKATSATLNGTVCPEGIATSYWFEYGTSEAYGSKTSTSSTGSESPVSVSKAISGLSVDTTYHYRLVAENEFGLKSYGEDMTVGAPTYRSYIGSAGSEENQFTLPAGIAVDPSGDVWVADAVNSRIEKWSPSGEFLFAFGGEVEEEEGPLSSPSAIAIDSKGHLLVADPGNGRIEEFSEEGEFLFAFGEGELTSPEGIAIDPEGDVWVADRTENNLQEFDSEGNWMGTRSGYFQSPRGIAIAPTAEGFAIYVADAKKNRIIRYVTTKGFFGGKPSYGGEWGSSGSGNGQFNSPDAVATDSEGNVWVMDKGNGRVQELTEGGAYIAKFAPTKGGFSVPGGIATDSDGNIWLSNAGEYRVERWSR